MAIAGNIAKQKKDEVSTPSVRYDMMREKWSWDLITDLCGGTKAMRTAGRKWLPQQEAEKPHAYKTRLERSFLFEGFENTIERLAARPFKKDVTWKPADIDNRLTDVFNNVNGNGTNMSQFAYDVFKSGLKWGLAHIMVDFPRIDANVDPQGRKLSIAEERVLGIRPKWMFISAPNLFFWRMGADSKLDEIRFFENEVVSKGDFSDEESQRIRRFTRNIWEIYEKQESKDTNEATWVKIESGVHTFGEIPLTTFYTDQDGPLVAKPPFLKLAWLNLTHWQSYSDQRTLLNVARAGVLFGKGFSHDQVEKGVEVGPRATLFTPNPDASLEWVEHTGASIEVGQKDIEDIENKMTVVGTEPLIITPPQETATGRAVDANNNESAVQAWIRRLEGALNEAGEFTARWLKITLPEEFTFDVFSDFGVILRSKDDLEWLLKARQSRELDQQSFLEEIRRRGAVSEESDIEEMIARLTEEKEEDVGMNFDNEPDDEGLPDDEDVE